jgi:alpha-ketoglutarate-dependent taurine dioxygenase
MNETVSPSSSADPSSLPSVLDAPQPGIDITAGIQDMRAAVDAALDARGAVLLRGFVVDGPRFAQVTRHVCGHAAPYVYRSTPRTAVGSNIYTATEYPASQTIPMHCENAYQRDWPMRLLFWCDVASATGGFTPLADMGRVTARIPRDIVAEFDRRRVMYVRNYTSGVDLSWQAVFQTQERAAVERFCRVAEIDCEWKANGDLRTRQVCQGVAKHPTTGALVWFNQAHLFHVSGLEEAARAAMLGTFAEEYLPRNAYFGDGQPIPEDVLAQVRIAFDWERVMFPWHVGDVLILDNMKVAHGRTPYTGRRRILVGMGLPYRSLRGSSTARQRPATG